MDYWKIKKNNYVVILFEYYMACHSKRTECGTLFVKSENVRNVIDELKKLEDVFIFFDMKYVEKVASRSFEFLKEEKVLDRIVFFDVQKGSEIYECLEADLHIKTEEIDGFSLIYFSDKAKEEFYKSNIKKAFEQKKISILKTYVSKESTFLPSSGIYSNMSLDYKKMFEDSENFSFIISELFYEIRHIGLTQRFDFLVAASKNAIALAAVLGSLLGKPAIYHTNIGQKYVKQKFSDKTENQIDTVQKSKKYLMIFDVICLGTEARILNGIINVLGGHLVGAVGMVCVQSPNIISKFDKDSILAKAKSLTTTAEMELGYEIALTENGLEKG